MMSDATQMYAMPLTGEVSHHTALRDIQDLIKKGILKQEDSGGRSTAYSLVYQETPVGQDRIKSSTPRR